MDIVEYEVIADFPGASLDVGETFWVYERTGAFYVVEVDVRWFPHLFREVSVSTDKGNEHG